jgi:hypothetical protein
MTITNKVRFTLSDQELLEINTALDTLYRILAPKTISLTPKQRRGLAKIGDKTFAFAEKALELGNQNPDFVPSYVNIEEANIDFQGLKLLRMLDRKVDALSQLLTDTQTQSGNEAFTVARGTYDQIKYIVKEVGSVESQKAKEELRSRFPKNPTKAKGSEASSEN